MTKKKKDFLGLETIQDICKRYAKGEVSMTELGKELGVSREKIRTIFAKAIIFGYVDIELANQIKDVAIRNNARAAIKAGITPNNNIESYYLDLIEASLKRKEASERIDYIRFTLEVYDDNFSCDDDYPYSKEELRNKLSEYKQIIKQAEEMI